MLQLNIVRITLFISIGLFLISLTQDGYCTTSNCDSLGVGLLIMGAIGFFLSPAGFTWLANPILFYSWRKARYDNKPSLIASLIAFILSLAFLFFKKIVADEAGNYYKIIGYQPGYWLWLMSSATMLIGNFVLYRQQNTSEVKQS